MTAVGIKPQKPRNSPIFPHACGQWAKKIGQRFVYFGPWSDFDAALARYHAMAAGVDAPDDNADTIKDVIDAWLCSRHDKAERGEMQHRTFDDYLAMSRAVVDAIGGVAVGKASPTDFDRLMRSLVDRKWGAIRRWKCSVMVRGAMSWGLQTHMIPSLPRMGPDFRVSKLAIRKERAAAGAKHYCPMCIERLLVKACPQLRAMILLAISGGLGNTDLANISSSHFDFNSMLIQYRRPKTEVMRTIPIWPEVHAAVVKVAVPGSSLLFRTKYGNRWVQDNNNAIAKEFSKLCKVTGVVNKGFYTLRRTWRTVADEVSDLSAIDRIMGHVSSSMGAGYVQRIAVARLRRVSDHVRRWMLNGLPAAVLAVSNPRDDVAENPQREQDQWC